MSIGLLLPLGLAALAALIVPLLIHLVRRPEQLPYDFPALRWITESTRPRRRPRLDDLVLLALRLILLALVALLLAVPVLRGEWRGTRHWILASSAVDLQSARASVSDEQAEWRWLAPGFPEVGSARPAREQPTSSLVREFESSLPRSDSMSVLLTAEPDGLDAERIALGRSVEWVVVPGIESADPGSEGTRPLKMSVRHADEDPMALHFVRAALSALDAGAPGVWQLDDASVSMPVDASSKVVIWLDAGFPDGLLPWVEAGGRAILVDPQAHAGSIVLRDSNGQAIARRQAVGKGEIIRILRPLTPEHLPMLLDAEFPEHLRMLIEGAAPPPTRAIAAEVEPILADRAPRLASTPLSMLLCLLIAITFLVERIVATRRRPVA